MLLVITVIATLRRSTALVLLRRGIGAGLRRRAGLLLRNLPLLGHLPEFRRRVWLLRRPRLRRLPEFWSRTRLWLRRWIAGVPARITEVAIVGLASVIPRVVESSAIVVRRRIDVAIIRLRVVESSTIVGARVFEGSVATVISVRRCVSSAPLVCTTRGRVLPRILRPWRIVAAETLRPALSTLRCAAKWPLHGNAARMTAIVLYIE